MKKPAAVLIAVILSIALMTGCSASDIGLTSLFLETANLKSYSISGNMEMEIRDVNFKIDISGDIVETRFDDVYLDLKIKYGINTKGMPFEANLRMYNNVMYMPVKDYIDYCIEKVYKLDAGYSDGMTGKIKAAFSKEFGGYDYVILGDTSELYQAAAFSGLSMYVDELADEQQKALEMIFKTVTDMFSGLSSGMTKAIPGGFALEVTPQNAVDFYDELFKCMSKNKKAVASGMVKLYKNLYSNNEELLSNTPDEKDIIEYLDMLDDYKISEWDKEFAMLMFRGSHLNAAVTKSGNVYNQSIDTKIVFRDEKLITLKSAFTQTVKADIAQKTVETDNPVLMDDIDRAMEKIERGINYIKSMEVRWWNWSYDKEEQTVWSRVNVERAEGSYMDHMNIVNEAGTVYLPMRHVLESFNEEVIWDAANKKAYVARGGDRIEMAGLLKNSTTFVKVRDFEKLGYTVSYEYEKDDWGYGSHKVTIRR